MTMEQSEDNWIDFSKQLLRIRGEVEAAYHRSDTALRFTLGLLRYPHGQLDQRNKLVHREQKMKTAAFIQDAGLVVANESWMPIDARTVKLWREDRVAVFPVEAKCVLYFRIDELSDSLNLTRMFLEHADAA